MTIGIIGAMDEEVRILLENMVDKRELTVAGCLFVKGRLHEKDVVLLKSGIGKVNAAMATTILIERFSPTSIINTGSAGGFSEKLNVGDVVISSKVVHHDVDVTAFDYQYGQVPGLPPMFEADDELVSLAVKAMEKSGLHYEKGIIATGDTFMEDPERVQFVREKFPEMIAAEMEAAAVSQVCYQYKIPFVITRALSDIAGKKSSVSFDQFLEKAAKNAATIIMEMVDNIEE